MSTNTMHTQPLKAAHESCVQPFPDVVNGCVLLLAKLFLGAENFVRTRIVTALRTCSRHLVAEASDIEGILSPIVRVLDSNDPVARTLTLEAIGHLSRLLGSRDDIQFRLLERLDSGDHFEAQARSLTLARLCFARSPNPFLRLRYLQSKR